MITITTQPFIRIDGERKTLEQISDGVARLIEVDIDFEACRSCGVPLVPGVTDAHARWHVRTGTS